MKRLLLVLFLGWGLYTQAQTVDDVELFSRQGLHGTPRFTGMGGAFTALGNDMSSIGINPAGLAVYRFSELGGTFGFQPESARLGPFYGTETNASNFNFLFENIGLGLQFNVGKSDWSEMAFGITYNKIADFDRDYDITGYNNNYTMGEFWGESSANRSIDVITDEAYAAWQAYLLVSEDVNGEKFILDSTASYAYGNYDSVSNTVTSSSNVRYRFNQTGSHSEAALSFGGQHSNNFFYGISLGFPTLTFRREEFITENIQEQDASPYDATEYTLRRLNDIYANGFNLKVGFIYTPFPELRIGASYQSPSWYTVTQLYEFDVTASFLTPPSGQGDVSTNSDIFSTDEYSYRLQTPAIWRFGLSSVLAKSLVLSLDYQYSAPSNNSLYTNNSSYNIDPAVLNNSYQPALNRLFRDARSSVAAGAEYNFGKFLVRGGYRWDQSPYQADITNITTGDVISFSGGIGFRFGATTLDISYTNSQFERSYVTYSGLDGKTGENVQVLQDLETSVIRHNILVGMTYKF